MRALVLPALGVLLAGAAAPALAGPRYLFGVGGSSGASDNVDGPGFSVSGSALWQVEPWLLAGPMLYLDDQGTTIGRLLDPNDGSDLGATVTDHRMVFGGAWRADLPFAVRGPWTGFAGAALGYYRIQDGPNGVIEQAFSATGASGVLGVQRRIGPAQGIGASFRYHRVFDDRLDYYWSATLDWMFTSAARARTPATTTAPAGGN